MNAIRLLLRQHDEIEALLKSLAKPAEEPGGTREADLRDLVSSLHAHLYIEEELFYPAIAERGTPAMVGPGLREHERCRSLLDALREAPPDDFQRALRALEDAFVEHVGDEELDLFAEVRGLFRGHELDEMGSRLAAAREEFIHGPRQQAPVQPTAEAPVTPAPAEGREEETPLEAGPTPGEPPGA